MNSPSLQILFNGKVVQDVALAPLLQSGRNSIRIGRMKDNDVVIDNLGVSRFHAKLLFEKGQVILEDQDSENGCFVNGVQIQRSAITPGDNVVIGKHQLVLQEAEAVDIPKEIADIEPPPPSVAENSAWDASSTMAVDYETQKKILERIETKAKQEGKSVHEKPPEPALEHATQEITQKTTFIAHLDICFKDNRERILEWQQPTMSIGRSLDCDIVLDKPSVSRKHALLKKTAGSFEIEDLDTGTGTFVNDQKIRKRILKPGDLIRVGDYTIYFQLGVSQLSDESEIPTQEVTGRRAQELYQYTFGDNPPPAETPGAPREGSQTDAETSNLFSTDEISAIENQIQEEPEDELTDSGSTVEETLEIQIERRDDLTDAKEPPPLELSLDLQQFSRKIQDLLETLIGDSGTINVKIRLKKPK